MEPHRVLGGDEVEPPLRPALKRQRRPDAIGRRARLLGRHDRVEHVGGGDGRALEQRLRPVLDRGDAGPDHDTVTALDGDRLQLASASGTGLSACLVTGLKVRTVERLPQESCDGTVCVRWRDKRLLRTRDRGKSWSDLTDHLPREAREQDLALAAAAGREVLVAVRLPIYKASVERELEVWRSVDDGATFAPAGLGGRVTSLAPAADGWYIGTALDGLVRVPFATPAR